MRISLTARMVLRVKRLMSLCTTNSDDFRYLERLETYLLARLRRSA